MIGLGSSSTLGIGLVIELRDRFTKNANQVSASMNNLHRNARKAMDNTNNLMVGMGAIATGVGFAIMKGFKSATNESIRFQKIMVDIKTLGQMSNTEMMKLAKVAQIIGPKYGKDAITVAKGMEDLVKAGLSAKDIPKVMEAILQTTVAANEKLEGADGVASRMTDIMMAWGLNANQASRVGDVLSRASILSTVSFSDLAESMKYSQDILKGLNLTFEESVAMMGVLGNAGIKGSLSGTSLGNAFRELSIALGGKSDKKNNALKALGIGKEDLMDAYGNLKRPLEILDRIKEGVKGMGDVQKQNVLNDLFGVRGKRGVNPLIDFLSKGSTDKWMGKSLKEMVKELKDKSLGSNMKIIEEKSKTAAFNAEKLRANWVNFKIAAGNAIMPLVNWVLPKLVKMMETIASFAETTFGKWLLRGVALFGALLIPVGAFFTLTGLIGRGLTSLTGGFVGFRTAALWVWNTLIARALTYMGIMKGIEAHQGINAAGSIFDKRTGRIVKTAAKRGLRGKGILGWLGKISPLFTRLGGWIGKMIPAFSRLLPVLGGVARAMTGVGLISLALSSLGVGLKDQLQLIISSFKWVIASIVNAVMGIIEWLPGVDLGGGGWSERQKNINKTSFQNYNPQPNTKNTEFRSSYENNSASLPNWKMPKKGDTIVNIHLDGEKTISKKINDNQENELSSRYGLNY